MNKKVIIIAEAGVNHNGCIENAKKFSNTCNTKNFEKSVKKSIEVSNIS